MTENVTADKPTDSKDTTKDHGRGTTIIAWLVVALYLLIQLPVFLAALIAPGPATAGSAAGALLGAAILRFIILKLGSFLSS